MIEEKIRTDLEAKFECLKDKVTVKRERRIFLEAPYERFPEVLDFSVRSLGFTMLATIIGSDEGENLGVMYSLDNRSGILLNLRILVPRSNPVVKTIIDVFPNADIYEREIVDLFGIKVEGLPEGPRYPLPDNWPKGEYPLRKDWKNNFPVIDDKGVANA